MKSKTVLTVVLVVLAGAATIRLAPRPVSAQTNAPSTNQKILYYTCLMHPSVKSDQPGACPICGMGLEPVYADDQVTNNSVSNAPSGVTNNTAVKPYPLDYCLVSGDELGAMGKPIVINYQGQEIKFCCPDCPPKFKKDPDKYIKKLQDAEAAARKK